MKVLTRQLPLAIILAYRLIPTQVRRTWSLGSSSSHLAVADIHQGGNGWTAITAHAVRPLFAAVLGIRADQYAGWRDVSASEDADHLLWL